jgi:hypothetical protein
MKLEVSKLLLTLRPETEAEVCQLEQALKEAQRCGVRHDEQRQWNIYALDFYLEQTKPKGKNEREKR